MRLPQIPEWGHLLFTLFVVSLIFRAIWLNAPDNALIFDEPYYVNAARTILGWPVPEGAHYHGAQPGVDPNKEHPPLAKVAMAASMSVLGDQPIGWRLPSLVAGLSSILLVFGLVHAAARDPWLALLAATIFSFDNLVLVHSRIATLDMVMVAFLLLAAWLYLRGYPWLAGIACALATLTKIGGLYGLAALMLYTMFVAVRNKTSPPAPLPQERGVDGVDGTDEDREAKGQGARDRRAPRYSPLATPPSLLATRYSLLRALWPAGAAVLAFLPTFLVGLWLLDLKYTTFRAPWDHVQHIVKYGLALSRERGPANVESEPWQWLVNEVQMPYLRVDEQVKAGEQVLETRPTIFFRGAMNPIIIGAAPLAISYVLWRAWRLRDALSLWTVAWMAANYLPFVITSATAHRISYIFYILPTLPAIAVALAQLLRQANLPRPVLWGYLLMMLVGFAGYFPFRRWL